MWSGKRKNLRTSIPVLSFYWNGKRKPNLQTIKFYSTDLIYIKLTKARSFNPLARSVVNSYIPSRSLCFLFNPLIFYQFWHLSLLSQLTSLWVLPDLIGEYTKFFTELFHFSFSYFAVLFFTTLGGTITSHHMLLRIYHNRTLINRGASGWTLRTPLVGTRHRSNKGISFGLFFCN